MYVLGVDFGGGSSKATLMDGEGRVVATATSEYPTYYTGGGAEQEPADWYGAACKNIRRLIEGIDPKMIKAVCFDAATHTAVLMDKSGEVLRRSIYWTDTRCIAEKQYLKEHFGDELFKKCKHEVDTIWTLPELMFIKNNEPELYSKVAKVTFAKDYVRGRFTGDFITDNIEAEGSMLFDFDKREWDEHLLSLVGLKPENMPKIASPLDLAGTVCEAAARDSGLAVGTHVICGAPDTAMEVFAAGGVQKGDMTLKLATAGRICVISDNYFADKNIINYSHVKGGLYYPGSATKACASSIRWFRDTFGGTYSEFDKVAAEIQPGSDGLIYNPYLLGELTPFANPALRASFIGIGASHTKAHFVRAVLEGVAMSLRDSILYLKDHGVKIGNRAYVIGGGAKSEVWRRIVSDALELTLVSTENNDSSFGSAMCAGIYAGFFADFESAVKKCRKITNITEPNRENSEKYASLYERYKKVSNFLNEMFNEK